MKIFGSNMINLALQGGARISLLFPAHERGKCFVQTTRGPEAKVLAYQLNAFDINPLRGIVSRMVVFDRRRAPLDAMFLQPSGDWILKRPGFRQPGY